MKFIIVIALLIVHSFWFQSRTFSQSNTVELQTLTSGILKLLDEYGGSNYAQAGKFQGCTFYYQVGEDNRMLTRYTVPLGSLHYQSLRNWTLRMDKRYEVPVIKLKTAQGQALIDSTFIQWAGPADMVNPTALKTKVAGFEIEFLDEDRARAAAAAFARAAEICAGK